jgi:uncharacterized pyridoxal phosphate-containing UPF0001 family protein
VSEIADALAVVRARITDAATRAGRDPGAVRLIGASKTVAAARIGEALDAGLTDVGENRAQELLAKAPELADRVPPPTWHFVGRLQRNKVAGLAPWVACWQSVDRVLGAEATKGGCTPADAAPLVDDLRGLGLGVDGLMTVAPQSGDPRRWFAALRELRETLGLSELSMGMSEDFEAAVGEGATMVRVGRAIFGSRPV